MRTVTVAQRWKPEDEEGKQALTAKLFDVTAPPVRPLFSWFPGFLAALW